MDWGGADVAIVPPPPKGDERVEVVADTGGLRPLPNGPVVYYVRRTADGVVMMPVGEVAGDSLAPITPGDDWRQYGNRYIAELLRQGSEFTLFRNGRRAGTFVVESATPPPPGACPLLPVASGSLELAARDDSTTEYIAMPKRQAPEPQRMPTDMVPSRRMQVLGPILAERLLRARQSQLPGNWQAAMKQIYPFPVEGAPLPGFAGTLLVGDELRRGGNTTGFSLFFVVTPNAQASYDTVYARYTSYPQEGKLAPRTVDFLDWDRDGQVELLLYYYGADDEFFAAAGNRGEDGPWDMIFFHRCEQGGRPAAGPVAVESTNDTIGGSGPGGADTVRQ
ncbi:MAG: hypothetical protein ACRELD_02640 [Longimicrobiales bacterium]